MPRKKKEESRSPEAFKRRDTSSFFKLGTEPILLDLTNKFQIKWDKRSSEWGSPEEYTREIINKAINEAQSGLGPASIGLPKRRTQLDLDLHRLLLVLEDQLRIEGTGPEGEVVSLHIFKGVGGTGIQYNLTIDDVRYFPEDIDKITDDIRKEDLEDWS